MSELHRYLVRFGVIKAARVVLPCQELLRQILMSSSSAAGALGVMLCQQHISHCDSSTDIAATDAGVDSTLATDAPPVINTFSSFRLLHNLNAFFAAVHCCLAVNEIFLAWKKSRILICGRLSSANLYKMCKIAACVMFFFIHTMLRQIMNSHNVYQLHLTSDITLESHAFDIYQQNVCFHGNKEIMFYWFLSVLRITHSPLAT